MRASEIVKYQRFIIFSLRCFFYTQTKYFQMINCAATETNVLDRFSVGFEAECSLNFWEMQHKEFICSFQLCLRSLHGKALNEWIKENKKRVEYFRHILRNFDANTLFHENRIVSVHFHLDRRDRHYFSEYNHFLSNIKLFVHTKITIK